MPRLKIWDGTQWLYDGDSGSSGGASVAVQTGAPTTPALGDMWYDTDDTAVSAGSAPRGEIGYVQLTAGPYTTTSTTAVDLTGMSLTVEVQSKPIFIDVYGYSLVHSAANGRIEITIYDVTAGATLQYFYAFTTLASNTNASGGPRVRVNPAPGTRTYNVRWRVVEAGTGTINTLVAAPFYMRITE